MSRILLAVDLQKQFKDNSGEYEKCISYINEHRNEYDNIIATLFTNSDDSMYARNLNWHDCGNASVSDLEFDMNGVAVIQKTGYGCSQLTQKGLLGIHDEVDIIGCELDACIMAVCFQLWDMGISFKVLTEYCWSNSDRDKESIVSLLKRNFGDCIY